MTDCPHLLNAAEVAARLGHEAVWFTHTRTKKNLAKLGFPRAVPGIPGRWDLRAIDAWLELQMPPRLRAQLARGTSAAPAADAPADPGVSPWAERLRASADAIAAEHSLCRVGGARRRDNSKLPGD